MRFASDWSKIMHRITAKIFKIAQNLSRIAYARFQTDVFTRFLIGWPLRRCSQGPSSEKIHLTRV